MFRLKYKNHRNVNFQYQLKIIMKNFIIIIIIIIITTTIITTTTAINFSLGGSSPNTSNK